AVKKFKVLKKMINVNVILVNEDTFIEEAFNISVNKDITVYDSLYLALSLEKKAPLATLDEKQRKVAKELSLKVLP
ncbi:MAG TPA: PIN domain-containing protein, partial [Thermoproteales archaeon]|nr:PIN domain-containing protein [Thermoproteales archaeon]